MEQETKWVLTSKSVWLGLLTAAAALYQPAAEFVAANVEVFGMAWGILAVALRAITKDKVVLKP